MPTAELPNLAYGRFDPPIDSGDGVRIVGWSMGPFTARLPTADDEPVLVTHDDGGTWEFWRVRRPPLWTVQLGWLLTAWIVWRLLREPKVRLQVYVDFACDG